MAEVEMINEVQTSERVIAITFDDGPNPIFTPQLFQIFSEVQGRATFFMIGEQMAENPGLVKQAAALGHEIGNHTYTHPKLSELSPESCLAEVEGNEKLVQELTGVKPVVLRPPYLDYSGETLSIMKEKGYPMIGALNTEAQDWDQPGVDHILSVTRKCVGNGSILIFHDGYGDRSQSIKAVRILVKELIEQGYQLVTVSELLKLAGNKE
ncbi:polysaccharide deacetylase family protein [Peribacillus kribbensis]|uniref:polysaccharide deacetylase family protein n=1 Tax=Peribacillus kribbensis TaxID=356658 RepID=UPI0004206A86|nr:polysaccharide deacetylase family protein [Peribacillus kribbensis]